MKKIIILILCVGWFSMPIHVQNPSEPGKNYDFSAVDKFIEQHANVYKDKVVVLVSRNGEIIYKKEWNLLADDKKPIASSSKWLSGAVIMTLVDEGKLSLNDTIGKFLPIFSQHRKGNITIRQLFSHTSGFPGNSKYEFSRELTIAQAIDSIAVHINLIHPPGTVFNYGGLSMQIGGRIAEIVSGKSWQELFNEKIANPCGLQATYNPLNPRNPMMAAGVNCSSSDYLKFLEMIVNKGKINGKQVIRESSVAEMMKDQTNGAKIEGTPYKANPHSPHKNTKIRYGIGNWLDVIDDSGKVLETSSPGAFGTHPWQDPEHNVAGIIFTVTDFRKSQPISLRIREMIRDEIARNGK